VLRRVFVVDGHGAAAGGRLLGRHGRRLAPTQHSDDGRASEQDQCRAEQAITDRPHRGVVHAGLFVDVDLTIGVVVVLRVGRVRHVGLAGVGRARPASVRWARFVAVRWARFVAVRRVRLVAVWVRLVRRLVRLVMGPVVVFAMTRGGVVLAVMSAVVVLTVVGTVVVLVVMMSAVVVFTMMSAVVMLVAVAGFR
jgi:hypothetical protein